MATWMGKICGSAPPMLPKSMGWGPERGAAQDPKIRAVSLGRAARFLPGGEHPSSIGRVADSLSHALEECAGCTWGGIQLLPVWPEVLSWLQKKTSRQLTAGMMGKTSSSRNICTPGKTNFSRRACTPGKTSISRRACMPGKTGTSRRAFTVGTTGTGKKA